MRSRTGLVTMILLFSVLGPPMTAPASAQGCSFPVTLIDATGTEVTIPEEPSRVVTLSPSAAQTMWEIDAHEKVIGLTKYAAYLEGSASRTQVSTTEQMVSIETVVNLTPDLVLAPNVVAPETVAKLRDAGVTVYYFPPAETIEDVYAKTQRIGRLTGECEGAAATVSWMKDRIGVARAAAEGQEPPGILYLFFGYTAGSGTFINEIIETAGGNNLAVEANVSGYQRLSEEVVVRSDPEWIIRNSENPTGIQPAVINQTTAAQQNQLVVVQIEHLNQPAPRIVYAITKLAKAFHPEAYAAANSTATPTTTPTTPTSPDTSADGETPAATRTQAPGQDGFGVLLTVLCLTVSALLMGRR